jgi:AraC-like DNA-binding protein
MFFNLCQKQNNVLQAELLPDKILSNTMEEKVLNFRSESLQIAGWRVSLSGFLFATLTFTPALPIKLNFILPTNFCLIACVDNAQQKHMYGFMQYQNQQPITLYKQLSIKLLYCKCPYGDAFIAPTIDTLNLALIQKAFNHVLACIKIGISKNLFLKAKFYEILSIAGEHQTANCGQQTLHNEQEYALNPEDAEKISHAKAIIEATLQNPCGLIELAHTVGLNDFKLKKCFKKMYGTTVFGHLHNVRMKKACTLLLQKQKISEVAYTVGYKNAQHFTAAFKKRFGMVPSQFLCGKK